jgi:hypothetical protein
VRQRAAAGERRTWTESSFPLRIPYGAGFGEGFWDRAVRSNERDARGQCLFISVTSLMAKSERPGNTDRRGIARGVRPCLIWWIMYPATVIGMGQTETS